MGRRGRTVSYATLAMLVAAGLVGAACGGPSDTTSAGPGVPAATTAPQVASRASGAGGGGTTDLAARDASTIPAVPAIQQRVVKTAGLALTLRRRTFDDRFQQATQIAAQNGGYVASSETAGRTRIGGTLVIRVPASQFETALGELKGLGRVSSLRVSGQDVTAQFVDLQARLRNWQAQEAVLLQLMRKSTSITDSIRVQQQLQDVQLNIEEITGQLRVLGDQADLSTITVSMAEAGPVPQRPKTESGLARAWHQAVHGFVAVIAAVVVGLGYLLPFALFALLGLLLWGLVRRQRSPLAAEAPAP